MVASRREHLLNTALSLFNQYGFHATGIDKIQAESGVSKTTLYKYFKSKDELIKAVLELRHEQFGQWFESRVNEIAKAEYVDVPDGHLKAVFDTLSEWFHSDTFFGCNFINATAEYSDITHPIHRYSSEHKLGLSRFIQSLLHDVPGVEREELSLEILLLIEGAIVCAHTSGLKESAERAKRMMGFMVASHRTLG
ncbi:MAG: AcrR family transcriptional regulator [Oleiphilaceae bacterium]|jgi:AcrR family transcriptional regulator